MAAVRRRRIRTVARRLRRYRRLALVACLVVTLGGVAAWIARPDPEAAKAEHFAKGDEYFEQERYAEAIVEYRTALQFDPRFGVAHYQLGNSFLETHNLWDAIGAFVRAADVMEDDAEVQLRAAGLLALAGQFEDAETRTRRVLVADPENLRARILLANLLAGLSHLDEAIVEVGEALELDPASADGYASLALIQYARNEFDAAEATFQRALEFAPDSVAVHMGMARFYDARNRQTDAEAALRRVLEIQPRHVGANQALAMLYFATDRRAEAEPYLRAILEVTDRVGPRLLLADYLLATGRVDESIQILTDALASDLGTGAAEWRLAIVTYATGSTGEAHAIVDRLLVRMPSHLPARLLKAQFLLREGAVGRARAQIDLAAAAQPDSAGVHYLSGLAASAEGQHERATRSYSEVLKLNPGAASTPRSCWRIPACSGGTSRRGSNWRARQWRRARSALTLV